MALRLLHLADVHLGMENDGRLEAATGLHRRLLDFARSAHYAIDYALDHGAQAHRVCISPPCNPNGAVCPSPKPRRASRPRLAASAGRPQAWAPAGVGGRGWADTSGWDCVKSDFIFPILTPYPLPEGEGGRDDA